MRQYEELGAEGCVRDSVGHIVGLSAAAHPHNAIPA
jgi:hypothetical protein